MPGATIIKGTVFEDSGASAMARIVDNDGTLILQADFGTITYGVFDMSDPGASSNSLTVATVVFDTLQTDSRWTIDTAGYNFRHDIPASDFGSGAKNYRFEYKFAPSSGEAFHVVFEIATKDLLGT